MKQIHCVNIMYICTVLLLFFYAESVKAITYQEDSMGDQDVMRQTANLRTLHIHKFFPTIYDNGCECIKYHCGCCISIKWDQILNGKLCANVSYLDHNEDYEISMTLTYDDITLFNKTITARKDPQPICMGDFAGLISICLQIYDINVDSNGLHICFKTFAKIMNTQVYKLKLGCIG